MKQLTLIIFIICTNLIFSQYDDKSNYTESDWELYFKTTPNLDPIEGIYTLNLRVSNSTGIIGTPTMFDPIYKEEKTNLLVSVVNYGTYFEIYNISKRFLLENKITKLYNNEYDFQMLNHKYEIKNQTFKLHIISEFRIIILDTFEDYIPNTGKTVGVNGYDFTFKRNYNNNISPLNKSTQSSTGSGFSIGQNYVVTNYHVVENANTINIKDKFKTYSANVVLTDAANDLAVLQVDNFNKTVPYSFKLSNSDIGEDCYVLGYPLSSTMGDNIKLTNGIISSLSGFKGSSNQYQMTCPVNPGNSGAPLFDSNANLIGIVNAKHKEAENAGYAIKFNNLYNLISQLNIPLNTNNYNSISNLSLSEQVKRVQDFVYLIQVNGSTTSTPNYSSTNNSNSYNTESYSTQIKVSAYATIYESPNTESNIVGSAGSGYVTLLDRYSNDFCYVAYSGKDSSGKNISVKGYIQKLWIE